MSTLTAFLRLTATQVGRQVLRLGIPVVRTNTQRAAAPPRDEESRQRLIARLLPGLMLGVGGQALLSDEHALELAPLPVKHSTRMVPASIEMLLVNDIPVPPRRLLRDLRWDLVANLRDEAMAADVAWWHARLEKFERHGLKLDASTTREVLHKFEVWSAQYEMQVVLDVTPVGAAALNEVLAGLDSSVAVLKRRSEQTAVLLAAGKVDEARVQCERVLQMAERATDVLEHVTKNVQASARVKNADLANLLAGAGAFAVVGVGCYYLGCAPTKPAIPAELMQTLAGVAALSTVVCLGHAAFSWFASQEAHEYCDRLRQAQMVRRAAQLCLEEIMDACLFGEA